MAPDMEPHSHLGRCRWCLQRREVYAIRRRGGGTYRRGGRSYWSSICGECAVALAASLGTHPGATVGGFGGHRIREIAATQGQAP